MAGEAKSRRHFSDILEDILQAQLELLNPAGGSGITGPERIKLQGIQSGATYNRPDSEVDDLLNTKASVDALNLVLARIAALESGGTAPVIIPPITGSSSGTTVVGSAENTPFNLGLSAPGTNVNRTFSPNDGRVKFNANKTDLLIGPTASVTGNFTVTITDSLDGSSNGSVTKTILVKITSIATLKYGLNLTGGAAGMDGDHPANPGVENENYIWPDETGFDLLTRINGEFVRLDFRRSRLQPGGAGTAFNTTYKQRMLDRASWAQSRGLKVIWDCHDYGREIIGNPGTKYVIGSPEAPRSAFNSFWAQFASEFKPSIVPSTWGYEITNEPNNMGSYSWMITAQGAANAIATQDPDTFILVPGDHWSSMGDWTTYNEDLVVNHLTDNSKIIYVGHSYPDLDSSGQFSAGHGYEDQNGTPALYANRAKPFLDWGKRKGFKLMVTECGIPADTVDERWSVMWANFLDELANSNIVIGVTPFAYVPYFGEDFELQIAPKGGVDRLILKTICARTGGEYIDTPQQTGDNFPLTLISPVYGPGKFGTTALAAGKAVRYAGDGTPAKAPIQAKHCTLEFWMKSNESDIATAAKFTIRQVNDFTIGTNYGGIYITYLNTNGSATYIGTNFKPKNGDFSHVAVCFGSNGVAIYGDGVLAGSSADVPAINQYSGNFELGQFEGASDNNWPGSTEELAIFNIVRYVNNFTPPSAPYVGNETGLVALYHLNDPSGNGGNPPPSNGYVEDGYVNPGYVN